MKTFVDTNVYIIGELFPSSPEEKLLENLGLNGSTPLINTQILIAQELINQVLRVGKRVKNKDWASQLVDKIWYDLDCLFVLETDKMKAEVQQILDDKIIPCEDIFIYLTAKYGEADCFVSVNRELIKSIADFECLTVEDFLEKYCS